jgi:hypothetical protein
MTNIKNEFLRNLLLITIVYFCFFIVFPSYLYIPNNQYFLPLLDYSSFSPSPKAGGDIELLVNFTSNSPFSPLLKATVFALLNIFKDPNLVIQLIFKFITIADLFIFLYLIYLFKNNLIAILILFISIISYPFIHEIERGQWNFICSAFIFAGLLTKKPTVAMLCFTLAFQLKIFPVLFAPLLFKRNYFGPKFVMLFATLNLGLFSILGLDEFIKFINNQILNSVINVDGWDKNPSVDSFIDMLGTGLNHQISNILKWILLTPILVVIILQIRNIKSSVDESNIFLLISIFIVLAIPLSYDYRLSILIIPFVCSTTCHNYSDLSKNPFLKYIMYFMYLYLMIKTTYVAQGFISFSNHLYPWLTNHQYAMLYKILESRFPPLYFLCLCFLMVVFDRLFYKPKNMENRVNSL